MEIINVSCQAWSLTQVCSAVYKFTTLTDYRQEHTLRTTGTHDFLVTLQSAVEGLMHQASPHWLAEVLYDLVFSYLCFIPELRHVIKVLIFFIML